jgi:hypothetical protein
MKVKNAVEAPLPDIMFPALGFELDVGVLVGEPDVDEVDEAPDGAVPFGDMTLSRTWMRPLFVLAKRMRI